MKFRKAIGPVIATALLIVVSVVAVIGFQVWFGTYSSQIFTKTETDSSSENINYKIETLTGSSLYFNSGNSNLTFEKVLIGNKECQIVDIKSKGNLDELDLGHCLDDINESTPEIVVITNNGIYSKKIYLANSIQESLGSKGPVYTDTFISVWNTSENGTVGSSASNQIKLPLQTSQRGGVYNFTIDWGDGIVENITNNNDGIHTYAEEGVYTLKITGTIKGFNFADFPGDRLKLYEIKAWGPLNVGNSAKYFLDCANFDFTGTDDLNLSGTFNLISMFWGADSFNGDISNWDTSQVTNMDSMFLHADIFNCDISNWNVSSVTNMRNMFVRAYKFNQSLNNWDVSSVTSMEGMFSVSDFNGDISNWDVSSVTDMKFMFRYNNYFNQDLNDWDVSSVTNMSQMFAASHFNGSISKWNVSSVTDMSNMFYNNYYFNQDLSSWDVDQVISCSDFNYSANSWELFNQIDFVGQSSPCVG